jgi:hypothetical protein
VGERRVVQAAEPVKKIRANRNGGNEEAKVYAAPELPASTQLNLKDLSRWSGVSEKNLQDVYDRGVGAHRTNPGSVRLKGSFKKDPRAPLSRRLSKEQWAFARVYAFLDKLEDPEEKLDHDHDVAKKIRIRLSKEGSLGKYGYKTALPARERQASLKRAVEAGEPPLRIFRRLNVLSIYNKNRSPALAEAGAKDASRVEISCSSLSAFAPGSPSENASAESRGA